MSVVERTVDQDANMAQGLSEPAERLRSALLARVDRAENEHQAALERARRSRSAIGRLSRVARSKIALEAIAAAFTEISPQVVGLSSSDYVVNLEAIEQAIQTRLRAEGGGAVRLSALVRGLAERFGCPVDERTVSMVLDRGTPILYRPSGRGWWRLRASSEPETLGESRADP